MICKTRNGRNQQYALQRTQQTTVYLHVSAVRANTLPKLARSSICCSPPPASSVSRETTTIKFHDHRQSLVLAPRVSRSEPRDSRGETLSLGQPNRLLSSHLKATHTHGTLEAVSALVSAQAVHNHAELCASAFGERHFEDESVSRETPKDDLAHLDAVDGSRASRLTRPQLT